MAVAVMKEMIHGNSGSSGGSVMTNSGSGYGSGSSGGGQ